MVFVYECGSCKSNKKYGLYMTVLSFVQLTKTFLSGYSWVYLREEKSAKM